MARPKSSTSEAATVARMEARWGPGPTRKFVQHCKQKGYDLENLDVCEQQVQQQDKLPPWFPRPSLNFTKPAPPGEMKPEDVEAELAQLRALLIASKDLKTAQTIKVKISGLREVLKELREQGKYILRESATAAGMKAGLASRNAWERIEDELPPMLDGLTAAQMKAKLRDYGRSQCLELAEHFAS